MSATVIQLRLAARPAPALPSAGGVLGELLAAMDARDTRAWEAKHGRGADRDAALARVWRLAVHKRAVALVAWMHRGYAPVLVRRHDGWCYCGPRKKRVCVECCEVLRAECPCPSWAYLARLVEGARTANVRVAHQRDLPRPGLRLLRGGV